MEKFNARKLKKLKTEYLETKRIAEDVKGKVEKIQVAILEKYPFYEGDESLEMVIRRFPKHKRERILKPFNAFKMSDDDFQRFLDLTYEEYKKSGIDDPRGRNWCPEAIPQDKMIAAEKALAEYAISIVPDWMGEKEVLKKAINDHKWREKVIEIALRFKC